MGDLVLLFLVIACVLSVPLLPPVCRAEDRGCDSELVNTKDPNGYQRRGDRCEGFFAQKIVNSSLTLVSFYELFPSYDIDPNKTLTIEWNTPPAPTAVHLHATGIGFRIYYRMDTELPANATSYTWPLDVLSRATKSRTFDGEGMLGWIEKFPDGPPNQVYLTLRMRQGAPLEVQIV
jgi:hypothetical protein